ncbi:hypothetical protein Taro_017412 [Colocasia esculenta]|uniref:Retrotransposon gag domain-containing protein n=1 Tax=Colocasia esculenta TaxID=4460 RepID=A0A843UR46_COLES|nr:hypothetical protein [Colocasia esculenta]
MAPRRRPREGVAEQATRQEAGDAPPPHKTQPLPQDAHSGIAPPPPPPQVAQGLDMTRFLEGMAQFVAQHRDAPVPQGGTGKVLREFLQFQPPQFLGQPDPDAARAWLDAVERTFCSMECVLEERVLLASYQLQAQALTWWSSEWETTFQSHPLRQIPWQEFVIMADEGLRTQQFMRGLRPELRQALIVARVTDLDAAYRTVAALEADTLRTRARSADVQTRVVPSQPRQQQGSVQTTPRIATSYASTSTGTTAKSGSWRKFRRDRRQAEQRQQSQQQQQAPVQQRQQTGGSGGSRGRGRVTHLTRADAEAAHLVEDSLEELSSGESVELVVELPTGDFVLTSYCLEEVPVQLQDQWLSARLFALQLHDDDVILGMDWLERYGAVMDCQKKRVHLRIPREAAFYFQGIEFVVSFETAFCPTYVRTERLYQFLDLQQRDFTVVQYRARFVELGRYAPQIMADEGLRTQQFVRGLRPELRQALIVARVTDLDAAYQTVAALEADTLRTRSRSAEVQTEVVPSQPRQQQGSVQTTPSIATSYASTSTGTTAKSGSRRKFRRDGRQAEQRQQSVGSVQQPTGQPSQ